MKKYLLKLIFAGLIINFNYSMAYSNNKSVIYYEKTDNLSFKLGDSDNIFIDGDLTQKTVNDFIKLINLNKIVRATVYFNSQGGDLLAGIKIGKIIREFQYNTSIGRSSISLGVKEGVCYSSCVFAFSGGKYRYMNDKDIIGVHRFYRDYSKQSDLEEAQLVSAIIINHLKEMDVDIALFERMALTSKNMVYKIPKTEALKLRLVNNGIFPTKWALDSIDGSVYLRGYRESVYGEGKLIFICDSDEPRVIAMHSASESVLLAGQYNLDINDKEYRIEGDFSNENGFFILSFRPNIEYLKQILLARSIGFKFLAMNQDFFVGFNLEIGENKKNFDDYIQRCIRNT